MDVQLVYAGASPHPFNTVFETPYYLHKIKDDGLRAWSSQEENRRGVQVGTPGSGRPPCQGNSAPHEGRGRRSCRLDQPGITLLQCTLKESYNWTISIRSSPPIEVGGQVHPEPGRVGGFIFNKIDSFTYYSCFCPWIHVSLRELVDSMQTVCLT